MQDPPFAWENLLSGRVSGRDSRFRAQTMLGSDGVLTSRQEGFARQLRGSLPDARSGLIMGDFTIRKFSPQIALEPRDAVHFSPLCFSRKNYPVTAIVGESCDSGFSPALDVMAKRLEV